MKKEKLIFKKTKIAKLTEDQKNSIRGGGASDWTVTETQKTTADHQNCWLWSLIPK